MQGILLSPKWIRKDNNWTHYCPGCEQLHTIECNPSGSIGNKHDFKGTLESASFSPIVLQANRTCQYFIKDGVLIYTRGTTHAYAGRNLEVPDIPEMLLD